MKRLFVDYRKVWIEILLLVLLAGVFAAGILFTGCSAKTDSSGGALTAEFFTAQVQGEITVSAYNSMTFKSYLEEAAALFQQRYPGTKINVETFSAMPEVREMDQGNMRATLVQMQDDPQSRADYISRANTNIMSGTGADIYAMDILPLHKLTESGSFENLAPYMDIDPAFNRNDYRRNILDALDYRGGTWFIPMDYSFNYYAYDSTLVPAAIASGFGSNKAFNTKELLELGMPLYTGANKLFNTVNYDRRGGMFRQLLNESISYFANLETKRANFADGTFAQLLQSIKNYGEEGYLPQAVTAQADPTRLMQGEMADPTDRYFFKLNSSMSLLTQFTRGMGMMMMRMYGGNAQSIEDDDEIAGVQALADGKVPFSYNMSFGINSQSKNKLLAWTFIRFLLSEEMQLSTNMMNGFPINNNARAENASRMFSQTFMGPAGSPMSQTGIVLSDQQKAALEKYIDALEKLSDSINTFVVQDTSLYDMIASDVDNFFNGSRSMDEVIRVIQNKTDLYLNE